MGINKRLINTGGGATPAPFDPLANFETVAYTGTGATQKINGYIRKGAAFKGGGSLNGSQISISNTVYGASTTVFSISAWVRCTNTATTQVPIFGNGGTIGGTVGFAVYITSGKLAMTTKDSSGESYFPADENGTVINDGDWKHVCLSYNNGAFVLYLNGNSNLSGTSTRYKNNATPTFRTFFGNRWNRNESSSVLIGAMDQIRVFNTAISSGNAATLAAETYASATKSTTDIFGNGSGVALYELEDNSLSSNFGQAAVFNGSAKIETNADFDGSTSSGGSISFWFKSSNTSTQIIMGSQTGDGSSSGSTIYLGDSTSSYNNDSISFWNESSGASDAFMTREGHTAYSDGEWHHAVFISKVDGSNSTKQIWIDGVSKTVHYAATGSVTKPAKLTDIEFGQTLGASSGFYNGSLDQVRIFNTALSTADVTKLYKESSQIPTTNLVAHYTLNGNALDSKGSNNGTETSITYADGVYSGTDIDIDYLGMAFQPDFVWMKNRTGNNSHALVDSVRGRSGMIFSDVTTENRTSSAGRDLVSFDSNGFTVGNPQEATSTNGNGGNIVAWCWKGAASTTTISANSVGNTIASDVRANVNAGFSIVKYTGNVTAGATVAHGLSSAPEMIMVKGLDNALNWIVYHIGMGATKYIELNNSGGQQNQSSYNMFDSIAPSSTVFTLGNLANTNSNTKNYIAYCFHSVAGYQKVDSYQGDANSLQTIATGFQVRFVLIKAYDGTTGWAIYDSTRGGKKGLQANVSAQEFSNSSNLVNFLSNGFQVSSLNHENTNGKNYIYLAIA